MRARAQRPSRWGTPLILLLVALAGCGDDGEGGTGPAETTLPTSVTQTTTQPPATTGPTATSASTVSPERAAELATTAVAGYIDAIAAGDLDGAWELLAEPSRQAVGGLEAFEAMRGALSEGIGAWAASTDRELTAVPVDAVEGTPAPFTWLVVVAGTVPLEGPPALHATSMPVYVAEAAASVSPFEEVFAQGEVFSFEPPPGGALAPDQAVSVVVPDDLVVATFVDGEPARATPQAPAGGQQRLEVRPGAPLTPGPHTVTALLRAEDGSQTSISAAYEVTG